MESLKKIELAKFFEFVEKNICKLTQTQKKQYFVFYKLLYYNNLSINLISRKECNIIDRHFINSVILAYYLQQMRFCTLLDIGSGGGFPGVVLKILFPDALFVLNDSIRKKTDFLRNVVEELKLKNIRIENRRAESLIRDYPTTFDIITARAVTSLRELFSISKPLIKVNGIMFFYKGKNFSKEFSELQEHHHPSQIEVIPMTKLSFVPASQEGCLIRITP